MSIKLREKPIFVVGAERSGTTMIMSMLGAHPRIAVPEVAWWYPRFYPYLHTYGDLTVEKNLRMLAEEMLNSLYVPYWGMDMNPATAVDELLVGAREKSFAGLFCSMHEIYASKNGGKPRWGQKTPHDVFFAGAIKEDFPNAQFIFITRDGRDAAADHINSTFGVTNIYCAAEEWAMIERAGAYWRERITPEDWMDIKYEEICRNPESELRRICTFLGEDYCNEMLNFWKSPISQRRSKNKDHAPLGHAVSDQYIGIYKEYLSLHEQRIFASVAGQELEKAGYLSDVAAIEITEAEAARYRESDGRTRAALGEMSLRLMMVESYNSLMADRREERARQCIWDASGQVDTFPIGDPNEEFIIGRKMYKKWMDHFGFRRIYREA